MSSTGTLRLIHALPGRLRIEMDGILGNAEAAQQLARNLMGMNGVLRAEPCIVSGRLLLMYDAQTFEMPDVLRIVRQATEPLGHADQHVQDEVASTREAAGNAIPAPAFVQDAEEKIPLSLKLAIGGLAILGVKRLTVGSSALAAHPVPFYLSGLVSVVTGYPFIRRGFRKFAQTRRWNDDLLLGAGALGLALVRENLIVLAGLTMLQYVNWRRQRHMLGSEQSPPLPSDLRSYGDSAAKWGIAAAGATWAFTKDPMRAIAVLLAANPRPALGTAEYTWKQAELESKERNYAMPTVASLPQLARTHTLLFEDASMLQENGQLRCIPYDDSREYDAEKIICLAASLMEKSSHPWKHVVAEEAKRSCRTIRTAFHVVQHGETLSGKVNEQQVHIGTSSGLRQLGWTSGGMLPIQAKRLARAGHSVLYIAKETRQEFRCIGMLVLLRAESPAECVEPYRRNGWRIGVLRDRSELLQPNALHGLDTHWLTLAPGEIIERIGSMRQQGEHVLLVTSGGSPLTDILVQAGVATIMADRLPELQRTADYARRIDQTVTQHLEVTKRWNVVGSALAAVGALTAPIVNLTADALSLLFMTRSSRVSVDRPVAAAAAAYPECAAAVEERTWHAMSGEEAAHVFAVNEQDGLSLDNVLLQRNLHGSNRLDGKKPAPWLLTYLGQFKEFTTLVLLGTAAIAFINGGLIDGLAMGAILLANAAIGTAQERKADKVLDSLNQYQSPVCTVIREGRREPLNGAELVPGDIVCMEAGDRVAADIRLLHSWNLRVNEAALTGESLPVEKHEASIAAENPLAERTNMLFMGTSVCSGKSVGIVVATGMNTEIGHLARLLANPDKEVTPLQQKVTSISKKFMKGALAAGILVFVSGLLRGVPFGQMMSTSITLAASAIPEGLPITITFALSAGIFRMAKKNTLIRKLSALETLGRTTVICTDKTGTLTKNEMTVKTVATVNKAWTVSGTGYEPEGDFTETAPEAAASAESAVRSETDLHACTELRRLMEISLLCNNSKLEMEDGVWTVKGDPTEGALVALAAKYGMSQSDVSHWTRGQEIPFDSGSGKMSVVCRDDTRNDTCQVFTKGSVETLLRHCGYYQADGGIFPLTEEHKQLIIRQNETFSGEALRVLAFAYRPLADGEREDCFEEKDMIYVGMAGMIDPPKPEVEASIREALMLGVKPVMITGDHPITAIAIGKQLGIYDGTQHVLSGHELDRMTDEELVARINDIDIFARVTPEHKLRIVTAFQKRGHLVAMTGDGVNDTPAIQQANVGIAMGKTGTEVTKETADMVLKEDHFGSIIEGVKEGRSIIGNIRKAIGCLLTGNLAEIIVTSAAVLVGLPIPLVPIQILLMNLLTDALPALVLAVSPGSRAKPSKRTDIVDADLYRKVVTRGVLLGIGSLGLFAATLATGAPLAVAQSVAFATLVAGQLIQTFSWRREDSEDTVQESTKDRFLIEALGISWLTLLAALYIPPLAAFFHTVPLSWRHWLPIFLVAGSVTLLSKPILSWWTARSGKAEAVTVPVPPRLDAAAGLI